MELKHYADIHSVAKFVVEMKSLDMLESFKLGNCDCFHSGNSSENQFSITCSRSVQRNGAAKRCNILKTHLKFEYYVIRRKFV